MRIAVIVAALLALLLSLGCGGGSGGGTEGAPAGGERGTGQLFITDGLDQRAQVWITIKKVMLLGAGGNVTAFESAEGVTVDLKTLRDENGERYAFLSTIPTGVYTGVSVTVDKTVTMYPRGSDTGQTRVFAGNDGVNALLSLTFARPKTIADGSTLVLDFSLSDWTDDGTTVTGTPFLRESRGDGLNDHERHEHNAFAGTVSALSGAAPEQSFTLSRGGKSIRVVTNSSTTIFFASGAEGPALANGQNVRVHGAFSMPRRAFVADSIRVQDIPVGDREKSVRGAVNRIDPASGTFTLAVRAARGMQVEKATVIVQTGERTVFISKDGVRLTSRQFFTELSADGFAEAEGTFDRATHTLAASRVRILGDRQGTGHGHGPRR